MLDYIWLVPFLPLFGFVINGLVGTRLPRKVVGIIACGAVGLAFLISLIAFFSLPDQPVPDKVLYSWIKVGDFKADFGFQVDPLSIIMILIVSGVAFVIHIYSIGYMHGDPGYSRYFTYLNLFVCAMLLLVLANNFLMMYIGWEGVGLCSYLLIGFWYERKSAADAGKKAFIVTRIGDFGFALGIMLVFKTFGTIDISEVMHLAQGRFEVGAPILTAITLLLFLGAVGKSAQIPLYVWLPDAMEGPTPVSALIHAATMVTAGVYMIARCNVLYSLSPTSLMVVAVIGCATAIYAASIGLVQNDIKRVLAYSTISQLGYMFMACGVGAFAASIFHLMTHAFFKALLFMGAGSVIHALAGEMDIRHMGGLRRYMPATYKTFLIAALAIGGIFPFAGFFSKDEILWRAFEQNYVLWAIGVITAAMTSFYIFRLVFRTFAGESRVEKEKLVHVHESPRVMTIPLVILGVMSVIGGLAGIAKAFPLLGMSRFFSEKLNVLRFLEPVTGGHHAEGGEAVGLERWLMLASLLIALLGIYIAYQFYVRNPQLPKRLARSLRRTYNFVLNKYKVDELYDFLFVNPAKRFSVFLWRIWDDRIIDGIVNGTAGFFKGCGRIGRRVQTGYVQTYILLIIIGAVIIIWYCL
ncbi:MAG: NADH-quinone oxidoreductase subunit L [Candidatus Aminicenantes bacterium]|nr:NADH-quinone oxidoreductase subunit L [Candidatus Aminicenantes bacterium]